jgi:hypothetical protein
MAACVHVFLMCLVHWYAVYSVRDSKGMLNKLIKEEQRIESIKHKNINLLDAV